MLPTGVPRDQRRRGRHRVLHPLLPQHGLLVHVHVLGPGERQVGEVLAQRIVGDDVLGRRAFGPRDDPTSPVRRLGKGTKDRNPRGGTRRSTDPSARARDQRVPSEPLAEPRRRTRGCPGRKPLTGTHRGVVAPVTNLDEGSRRRSVPSICASPGGRRRAGLHGLVLIDGKQHRVPRVLSRIPLCRPGHRSGGSVWDQNRPFSKRFATRAERRARREIWGETTGARRAPSRPRRTLWWVLSAVSRFPSGDDPAVCGADGV